MTEGFQIVLAASDEERRDLFVGAADRLRTNEQNIEKDFWVSWTLDALFNELEACGPRLLFKGGTSLSKGYGLIERFSEDIRILAPIIGIRRKTDEEAKKDDPAYTNKPVLVGFRNAHVFDVAQTDGAELPEMERAYGDAGENRDRLLTFISSRGIELVFTENIAPAMGVSYGGRIAILPGQTDAEEFATLVHEVAHELLHKAERRTTTTKTVKETEAEAVAFVVGKAVGLTMGSASADYIQLYHGNASLLAESLEVVQQTSAVILAALEPSRTETMADAELAQVA